jgi:hypothetical protein
MSRSTYNCEKDASNEHTYFDMECVFCEFDKLRIESEKLKSALEKLISVAELCDSWESFPQKALDEAQSAIDSYIGD